jgi:hypothetical protein
MTASASGVLCDANATESPATMEVATELSRMPVQYLRSSFKSQQ